MISTQRFGRLTAVVVGLAAVSTASTAYAGGQADHHEHGKHSKHDKPNKPNKPSKPGKGAGHYADVQILSFNDFHGNLEAPSGSSGRVITGHHYDAATGKVVDDTVDAGGAAYLATHLKNLRAGQQRSVTVAAGDQVGASPLLSAAFHDEPTIDAMNAMGVGVATVGNHEFDEGYQEMMRLIKGGCLPDGDGKDNQNSCPDGSFGGTDYPMVAANVFYAGTNKTVLPAYTIKNVKGVKVGFVGAVLKQTPDIVSTAGVKGLEFRDEVASVNAAAKALQRKGVQAIVAVVHQGGSPVKDSFTLPDGTTTSVNAAYDTPCAKGGSLDPKSEILPIAKGLAPSVDLLLTAHTHQSYVCDVKDPAGASRFVTSALSFGRIVTEADLKIDRRTGDVVRNRVQVTNHVVTRDVAPDATVQSIIDRANVQVKPIASRVLGQITADVTTAANAAGESTLGDLIADGQLADASVVGSYAKPQIAFMNPGGIRTDLVHKASGTEGDGVVTYEEAFKVQPFSNYVVSMDMTGAQIHAVLDQQVTGANASFNKILQVSKGFTYTRNADGTIDHASVKLDGVAIANDASTTYRVVANSFLSDGGDGFAAFAQATNTFIGGMDIDAFASYLAANSPYTPAPATRITR